LIEIGRFFTVLNLQPLYLQGIKEDGSVNDWGRKTIKKLS